MSCDVSDEYNSVENHRVQRARKEHRCCACRETIRRGDLYEYFFTVFDGEASASKRCLRCKAIYDELMRRRDPYGEEAVAWALDCGHTWEERQDDPLPDHIARLAFLTPDEMQRELGPAAKGST